MKKTAFLFAVLSATFLLGVGVFAFFFVDFYYSPPQVSVPESLHISLPGQEEITSDESKSFPGISQEISQIKKGQSGYFPKQILGDEMSPENSIAGWYRKPLQIMGEKSLLNTPDNTETYRFLWLRSFDHPVFVRVERRQDKIKLFTKELDGAGGYRPGKVLRSDQIVLKPGEFREFLSLLEKADYWNLPVEEESERDGAQWVLEGVKKGRYHLVNKWSPKKSDFRDSCVYLLKLSGIDVGKLKGDLY